METWLHETTRCVSLRLLPYLSVKSSLWDKSSTTTSDSVLDSNDTPLTAPIKQNNLLLFHEKKTKKRSAIKLRMQHFKRHAELYGQTFLVLDSRGGDLEEFFHHESSPYPPALLSEWSLNSCNVKKSLKLAAILDFGGHFEFFYLSA